MLRGALYRAAVKAVEDGEDGLYHDDIATAGHAGARPGPGGVRAAARRGLRRWAGVPTRACGRWSTCGSTSTWSAAGGSPCPTWSRPACWRSATSASTVAADDEDAVGAARLALRDAHAGGRARRSADVLLDEMRRSLAIDVECFDARTSSTGSSGVARRRCALSGRSTDDDAAAGAAIVLPRPGRAGDAARPGDHVRTRQVRPLPEAPDLVPRLRAGDHRATTRSRSSQDLLAALTDGRACSPRSVSPTPARECTATGSVRPRWSGAPATARTGPTTRCPRLRRRRRGPGQPVLPRPVPGRRRASWPGWWRGSTPPRSTPRIREEREEEFRTGRAASCCTARRPWSSAWTSPG